MTTLKVAIATVDEMKEWTMRVVRGEERRKPGDPKLWFPSVESFLKTLSVGHRKLLREIVEKHVSVSLDELSRMTGGKSPTSEACSTNYPIWATSSCIFATAAVSDPRWSMDTSFSYPCRTN